MKVIFWAISTYDPHDQYDSRIGMGIIPLGLLLFSFGVVFGVRACWTVVRVYQRVSDLLTPPIMLGIAGLLVPFFLGILWAARFLIPLIWSLSSLQTPQNLQKSEAENFLNRGLQWYQKGDYDQAIKDYTAAIQINPHYADAYLSRGWAWYNKKEYNNARLDYTKAIESDIQCAYAYNDMSWFLATCPIAQYRNGAKAVEFAKRAIELSPEIIYYWDTLAAAYAEIGDFNNAIATQEKVIHSLKKEGIEKELSAYLTEASKHLDAYKKHKPWREDSQ